MLLGTVDTNTRERAVAAKQRQACYYNRNTKERPSLEIGQTVRFKEHDQSDWRKGEISRILPHRSYEVQTEDGVTRRRTSKHVKFSREPPIIMDDNSLGSPQSTTRNDDQSSHPVSSNNETVNKHSKAANNIYVTRAGRAVVKPRRYQD
jgi:hypothetical protein